MSAPVSLPPSMVRLIRQSGHDKDCGAAAIGMLLGLRDQQALALCASVAPRLLEEGMTWGELQTVAERAGVRTKLLRPGQYVEDEATGVWGVAPKRKRGVEHFLFLWAGRPIEGNSELWLDADDYLSHYRYKAGCLLVRDE